MQPIVSRSTSAAEYCLKRANTAQPTEIRRYLLSRAPHVCNIKCILNITKVAIVMVRVTRFGHERSAANKYRTDRFTSVH